MDFWLTSFQELEADGEIVVPLGRPASHFDSWTLRFMVRHLIQKELSEFRQQHNAHYVRTARGKPNVLHAFPHLRGKTCCGVPLDRVRLEMLRQKFPREEHVWMPPHVLDAFNFAAVQLGLVPARDITRQNWKSEWRRFYHALSLMGLNRDLMNSN